MFLSVAINKKRTITPLRSILTKVGVLLVIICSQQGSTSNLR